MNTKSRRKSGRPTGDHAQRQRDISDVLLKVIGDVGFEKASMRVVAREANCTTGVLSHYFSSKEDLICHAVDLLFDWVDAQATAAEQSGDSIKALQLILGFGDEARQRPFDFWAVWLQVLARAKQNRRLAQLVAKRHGRFREFLTRVIREGQTRKQIRTDIAADLLADHINAVSDGLGLMKPIEVKRLTRERTNQLVKMSIAFLQQSPA